MKGLSIATALFTFSYLFKSFNYHYFTNKLTFETFMLPVLTTTPYILQLQPSNPQT